MTDKGFAYRGHAVQAMCARWRVRAISAGAQLTFTPPHSSRQNEQTTSAERRLDGGLPPQGFCNYFQWPLRVGLTVKVIDPDVPPPGAGVATLTCGVPATDVSAAVMMAVS